MTFGRLFELLRQNEAGDGLHHFLRDGLLLFVNGRPFRLQARDEQVDKARKIVNQVTGGLDVPDSGIMFAMPLTMVEGLEKKK